MKKYYIHNGQETQGPFNIEELKELGVNGNTPIWYIGLDKWILLKDAEQELKEILRTTPPPFNIPIPAPNELIQNNNTNRINNFSIQNYLQYWYAYYNKTPISFLVILRVIFILTCFVLLLYGAIALIWNGKNTKPEKSLNDMNRAMYQAPSSNSKTDIKANIENFVIPSIDKYSKTEGITTLKISIANHTGYLLDKVTLKLNYIKSNGTIWNTKEIHFDNIVKDNISSRTFIFKDEGTSVEYKILNIVSAELGL